MTKDMSASLSAFKIAGVLRSRHRRLRKVKLHKLLFFIQAEHLAWYGTPAFPEKIEAWKMGPVVASLWRREDRGQHSTASQQDLPSGLESVIHAVLARYRGASGKDLSAITHNEGPWFEITDGGKEINNQEIPHDVMREYAQRLPEELEAVRGALEDHPRGRPFVADSPEALRSFFAKN